MLMTDLEYHWGKNLGELIVIFMRWVEFNGQ